MKIKFHAPQATVRITPPSLSITPGTPMARDVISPYIKVEETDDGVIITCTDPDGTTTGEVYNGTDGTNGVSPEVTVESITGGHRVTITDAEGEHAFDVMDGVDGHDGHDGATGRTPEIFTTAVGLAAGSAPYANTSGTIEQPLITFGIPAGQNGTDGTDGTDGVSPEVTIASITGGHSVTITDADHPTGQTFNVMDGAQGNPTEVNGKTGASITLTASDVGALPDTYTAPVTSVNSKTGAVSLSASDVGALPDGTVVTNVKQNAPTASGYTYWRPLVIGYSSSASEIFTPTANDAATYCFNTMVCQPSSGTIKATTFKGNLAGTASGNLKSGDNVSALTNDAGYLTLSDLPVWDGGVI